MKAIKQAFWFVCGVGSIAIVLGYMVGASNSPVAGVAIPAIFGLVVMAFGLVGGPSVERKLDEIKEVLKREQNIKIERRLRFLDRRLKDVPNQLGKLLLIFALLYSGGLMVGAKSRIDEWFAPPQKQPQFPWANSTDLPPTASSAVDWIALQEQLLELGYDRSQIEQLYSIQILEWKKLENNKMTDTPRVFRGDDLYKKLQSVRKSRPKFDILLSSEDL